MHPCERCALEDESCCVSPFRESEDECDGIALTLSEVLKISDATGMSPEDFSHVRKMSEGYYDDADDVSALLAPLGMSIEFRPKNRACPFLGPKGCTIFSHRPMLCRLYPFWFSVEGDNIDIWKNRTDSLEEEGCIVNQLTWDEEDINKCLAFVGENKENLVNMIRKFLEEIELTRKLAPLLKTKTLNQVLSENRDILTGKISASAKTDLTAACLPGTWAKG